MGIEDRNNRDAERRARRKKQVWVGRGILLLLIVVIGVLCFFLYRGLAEKKNNNKNDVNQGTQTESSSGETSKTTETQTETKTTEKAPEDVNATAERMAAMYDYDGAIKLLKESAGYDSDSQMQAKVQEYEGKKAELVEYPMEEVTHIFYHTLIKDPSKAFDGDGDEGGYNQVMTTIDEFNKVTQTMYEEGYVLVNLSDMATFDENGNTVRGKIMLPPGKKAFVLSQDDVSYYHYMDGDGFATKLIVDENGDVKNEYIEDDGSVSVGDYDMVPLLDTFIDEHPDFSYHGAKGTIALTGYNGVLGYRTDSDYRDKLSLMEDQKAYMDANPDFNFENEIAEAKKVAEAMKKDGWVFASHTWGHVNAGSASLDSMKTDTEKWLENVGSIVGDTNIIIFAFGADIGGWEPYTNDNTNGKLDYLKSVGFDIYCNVDSSQYWVQYGDNFFRQGRRNVDGYRMYYQPELLSDLFDVNAVWDKTRPEPVPEMN